MLEMERRRIKYPGVAGLNDLMVELAWHGVRTKGVFLGEERKSITQAGEEGNLGASHGWVDRSYGMDGQKVQVEVEYQLLRT